MLSKNDLKQIGHVVAQSIKPLGEKIDTLELGMEQRFHAMDKRFLAIDERFDAMIQRIDQIQETTTDILAAVMEGEDDHEQRIKRIEKHLDFSQTK